MPALPPRTPQSYKIKRTDSAATVPNRVTFPQGTYISPPTSLAQRLPYQMSTGTQASGVAGVQGVPSAMYPQLNAANPFQTYGNTPINYGYNTNQRGRGFGQPQTQVPNIYTPDPRWRSYTPPPLPASNAAAQLLAPGQYMTATGDVKRGATPFGTNAFGERLDASGNVWSPETATRDIYGGRFIQPGETRWERNKAGRLVKVQYGKGGQKRIIRGGKNQSARRVAQRNAQQQQQAASYGASVEKRLAGPTPVLDNSTASAFVSFRA